MVHTHTYLYVPFRIISCCQLQQMKKEDKIQVSIIQKEEGKDITQINRPNSQSVDDDDESRVAWHGQPAVVHVHPHTQTDAANWSWNWKP